MLQWNFFPISLRGLNSTPSVHGSNLDLWNEWGYKGMETIPWGLSWTEDPPSKPRIEMEDNDIIFSLFLGPFKAFKGLFRGVLWVDLKVLEVQGVA
jgi:hypothetical protein